MFVFVTDEKKPPEQNVGPIATRPRLERRIKIYLLLFFQPNTLKWKCHYWALFRFFDEKTNEN